jgi:hypothetical protein
MANTVRSPSSIAILVIYALLVVGCQKPPVAAPAAIQPRPDYARFQMASGGALLYALDTKTGQLCRTLNNHPELPKGLFPVNAKPLDTIPLCVDLSQDEAATLKTVRGQ